MGNFINNFRSLFHNEQPIFQRRATDEEPTTDSLSTNSDNETVENKQSYPLPPTVPHLSQATPNPHLDFSTASTNEILKNVSSFLQTPIPDDDVDVQTVDPSPINRPSFQAIAEERLSPLIVIARRFGLFGQVDVSKEQREISNPIFSSGPQVDDIRQGSLSTCYTLSAMAATASCRPELIAQMIQPDNNMVANVSFARRLLPGHRNTLVNTVYEYGTNRDSDTEDWPAIIEAAYLNLNSVVPRRWGDKPNRILEFITGLNYKNLKVPDYLKSTNGPEQLWNLLTDRADPIPENEQAWEVSMNIPSTAMSHFYRRDGETKHERIAATLKNIFGATDSLVPMHDYAILGLGQYENGTRYVVLFNPHNAFYDYGNIFRLPFDQFTQEFRWLTISKEVQPNYRNDLDNTPISPFFFASINDSLIKLEAMVHGGFEGNEALFASLLGQCLVLKTMHVNAPNDETINELYQRLTPLLTNENLSYLTYVVDESISTYNIAIESISKDAYFYNQYDLANKINHEQDQLSDIWNNLQTSLEVANYSSIHELQHQLEHLHNENDRLCLQAYFNHTHYASQTEQEAYSFYQSYKQGLSLEDLGDYKETVFKDPVFLKSLEENFNVTLNDILNAGFDTTLEKINKECMRLNETVTINPLEQHREDYKHNDYLEDLQISIIRATEIYPEYYPALIQAFNTLIDQSQNQTYQEIQFDTQGQPFTVTKQLYTDEELDFLLLPEEFPETHPGVLENSNDQRDYILMSLDTINETLDNLSEGFPHTEQNTIDMSVMIPTINAATSIYNFKNFCNNPENEMVPEIISYIVSFNDIDSSVEIPEIETQTEELVATSLEMLSTMIQEQTEHTLSDKEYTDIKDDIYDTLSSLENLVNAIKVEKPQLAQTLSSKVQEFFAPLVGYEVAIAPNENDDPNTSYTAVIFSEYSYFWLSQACTVITEYNPKLVEIIDLFDEFSTSYPLNLKLYKTLQEACNDPQAPAELQKVILHNNYEQNILASIKDTINLETIEHYASMLHSNEEEFNENFDSIEKLIYNSMQEIDYLSQQANELHNDFGTELKQYIELIRTNSLNLFDAVQEKIEAENPVSIYNFPKEAITHPHFMRDNGSSLPNADPYYIIQTVVHERYTADRFVNNLSEMFSLDNQKIIMTRNESIRQWNNFLESPPEDADPYWIEYISTSFPKSQLITYAKQDAIAMLDSLETFIHNNETCSLPVNDYSTMVLYFTELENYIQTYESILGQTDNNIQQRLQELKQLLRTDVEFIAYSTGPTGQKHEYNLNEMELLKNF